MIFKRLLLKNYRKFKEKTIIFSNGINVIYGDNEAGKSTLTQALLDVLYIDPATQSKVTLAKINSWGSDQPAYLELEMENDGQTYLLIKDFAKKQATFINPGLHTETNNLSQITFVLDELMGLPTRELYKNTAFISNSEIAKIETNRDFVNALQNVATESDIDVNVQNIIHEFDNQLKQIRIGIDRHANEPGPLKAAQDRIEMLEKEIVQDKELLGKSRMAMESGQNANIELQNVNLQLADLEQLLANYTIYEKANARLLQLDEQIVQIEKILAAYTELESRKKNVLSDMNYYVPYAKHNLDDVTAHLNTYLETRKIANAELSRFSLPDSQPLAGLKSNSPFVALAYLVGGMILAAVIWLLSNNIVLVGSLAAIYAVIAGLLYMRKQSDTKNFNAETRVLDASREQWKLKIHNSTVQIQKILDEFRCEDVGGFFTNKAKFNMLNESAKEIEAHMAGLLVHDTLSDIKQKQLNLLREKKEIEVNQLTDEVKRSKIPAHEYLIKSREQDTLKAQQKKLETELTTARVKQEDAMVDGDTLTRLEEELAEQKLFAERIKQKIVVLQLARDTMLEAIKETAETANQIIEQAVQKFLPQLTQNRYSKIKIDSKFAVKVFSAEKNDWLEPIDNLSKGTVDQIYFLTRLGFLQAILKNKTAPLICDDPFVTFDSERKKAAREIMQNFSDKVQILLFSCSSEYVEWGAVSKIV